MKAIAATAVLLTCQPADSPRIEGPIPATLTVPGFRYFGTSVNGQAKKNLMQVVPHDAVLVVPTQAEASIAHPGVRGGKWIRTEMSCYRMMPRSPAHVRMYGTKCVVGCTEKKLRGHWLRIRVVGSGHTFLAIAAGAMPRHRPSRWSKAKHRMFDLLEVGWRKEFGDIPLGVRDVWFQDLGTEFRP